jgi:hypothetical protein
MSECGSLWTACGCISTSRGVAWRLRAGSWSRGRRLCCCKAGRARTTVSSSRSSPRWLTRRRWSTSTCAGLACAGRHPDLPAGLVLDSTLFGPGSLDDSLEVFERRGGAAAREAAARTFGGDTSPEAARAWPAHAMPLYGSRSDGDMAARGARVRLNREVLARFRRGECGPLEVTADDIGKVGCPMLVLVSRA